MRTRRIYAVFGVLATLVGVAVGHLVAALLNPDSSPVTAVATSVIDLTPASMKEWAIRTFDTDGFSIGPIDVGAGNYDKVVLVGSVMIGVLVLAAIGGVLARNRFVVGAGLLVVLVAVAGVAVLTRPVVEFLDVVPVLLTAVAGVASLWWLDHQARAAVHTASPTGAKPRVVLVGQAGSTSESEVLDSSEAPHEVDDEQQGPRRRGVLVAMGVLAAAAAVLGGTGRWISGLKGRPEDIALPTPTNTLSPVPAGVTSQYPDITPLVIDNADFYRVDTRLDTPVVPSEGWTLTIDGMVDNEVTITFDELLEMEMVERDITLTCVSNSVGGRYVGGARWLGTPLLPLLERAGIQSGADQMLATDYDGMTIGTPLELVTDGREPLLCVGMNGEPLPREHGFPVRVVIPGLFGFISATKWVTRITMTTYAETDSYWTERGWDTHSPIKPQTRIDTPRALAQLKTGENIIGGVSWAQNDGGVAKVQVQIDGGAWQDTELGPDVNNVYWRQWFFMWDADAGRHTIRARMVDGDGKPQTDARANPYPGGASGIQSIFVNVA